MTLYNFQGEGVERLSTSPRLFLADDMGLGKTIQAIVAAESIDAKKVLVICQNSMKGLIKDEQVIGGWAEEISIWAPGKSIGVVTGQPKARHAIIDLAPDYQL